MTVFFFIFLVYFFVVSGIVYDVIIEPPSIGSEQDPVTKQVKPVAIQEGSINAQFIIEGLSAGVLYSLGGFGLILVDWGQDKNMAHRNRHFFIGCGLVLCFVSYNLIVLFIRIKVPNYL